MWQLTGKLVYHHLKSIVGNMDEYPKPSLYTDDSLWAARCKYRDLTIKESQHLGKLLEEA
jgi:hypothetical protein